MLKSDAAAFLAGVKQVEGAAASAPTNLHVITGEVGTTSEDGKTTVSIDGLVFSEEDSQEIQIDTLGGLEEGDIATIILTGESGHGMTPLAIGGVGSVDRLKARVVDTELLLADKADIDDLEAATARIGDLEADHVSVDTLEAATARIHNLEVDHVSISDFEVEQANIDNLQAATADIATIRANSAKVQNLTAAQLEADHATVGSLSTTYATIENLNAANGRITNLESTKANISDLEADYITADEIEATYMHANMSNSDVAWIENGTIKNGAIVSAMINDVSANKLTAGTINGSVINVTNLNADNITTGTINGQRIGEGSLSLSKLEDDVYTETEVDAKLATMQAEIDGAIETWTGTAVPTLNNYPASSWQTSTVRDTHVGDVYFVVNPQSQQNGYNYRFTKSGSTYSWQLIKDSDVTAALQRISAAEGKITTFDSDISTLKTDTGSLTTRTTNLETRMSDAEDDILDKVDTTTFNEVSDTVDQHSQTISQHTTAIANKADSSTVTAVTNRVSKNEQDISGINTTIGELQDTVESKADGSTVSTISNKLNTVSDTVDGHTQTLTSVQNTLSSKADSSTVGTLTTKVNTIEDTVDGHTSQLSSITSTQTTMQSTLDKTVKSSIQLWYSKANTTAPSKPTSKVTSTSTSGNAWRIVVPAYNSSYPHYYYCWQYEYVDGTYGWSAVVRDIAMGESQSTARTADSNASSAVTTANTANTNASTALSTANTANTNASDAKTAATTASATASEAKTTAETAASDASTAKTNAASAVTTANSANTKANANIKSSVQLWFTKANSTAPNKPTSVVSTSNANTANAWNLVVPVWNSSYPHYFYCYQQQKGDGNYQWTDVVYDRATSEAQQLANTTSTSLTTLQEDYATYKQTTTENVTSIGTRLTTAEGKITTAETNITQNAQNIELKVSKEEFNNLEIGGRNLVWDTAWNDVANRWTAWGSPTTREIVEIDGKRWLHLVTTTTKFQGYQQGSFRRAGYGEIQAGDTLTISFMAYATVAASDISCIGVHWNKSDGSIYGQTWITTDLTTVPKRFVKTVSIADGAPVVGFNIMVGDNSAVARELWISEVKLEKGNKATDWTPAPEDIETRVSSAESAITQNANNIALKVSETDVTGNYIVGKINLDSTTASIAAQHINLQGAVTISDLSSDAQSATLNSNISVGGRNYAKTRDSIGTTSTVNGVTFTVAGSSTVKVNGTATAASIPSNAWFGGLTLDPGTYSLWLTNTNGGTLYFRLGKGASKTHVWSTRGDYGRETPYVFTVSESDVYWFGPICSAGTYSNVETRYMLEKGNTATDWTPAPEDMSVGGRNLLKSSDAVHTPTTYNAYNLYLSEPIEDGVPYVIQLWDVDVSHTGKTAATLGVNVYYCGSAVSLGGWTGTNYFTNGHADHLELRFTAYTSGDTVSSGGSAGVSPTNALAHTSVVNTTKKYIRLYNSVPSATGTMNLTVGKWKLEKGTTPTDWSPAPEDVDSAISDAAKTATSYVTDITGGGIMVHPSGNQNTGVRVTSDVDILRGGTSVANYGTTARIGTLAGKHVTIDSDSVDLMDGNASLATFGANDTHIGMSGTGNVYMANDKFLLSASTSEGEYETGKTYTQVESGFKAQNLGENYRVYSGLNSKLNYNDDGGYTASDTYIDAWVEDSTGHELRRAYVELWADPLYQTAVRLSGDSVELLGDEVTYVSPYNSYPLQLGKPVVRSASKSMTITSTNTWIDGPSVYLDQGQWLVVGVACFNSGSSSGNRKLRAQLRLDTSVYVEGTEVRVATNEYGRIQATAIMTVNSADGLDATLVLSSSMNFTSATTSYVTAVQLA